MVASWVLLPTNYRLNIHLILSKFSMELGGSELNHSRASPSRDNENAWHHMVLLPVRKVVVLVKVLIYASRSKVSSYNLN